MRCPTCNSPQPGMHPAVSGGGEVATICPDAFHGGSEWIDTGSLPVVADDNKPCDTCGKVHTDADHDHSEVWS